MSNDYREYVNKGRELVLRLAEMEKKARAYRAKIAEYALKVCDIRHGGRVGEEVYTVKRYSEDIGLKPKTVSGWISVYRDVAVRLGLNADEMTDQEWKDCSLTNNMLRKARTLDNKKEGKSGTRNAYKKKLPVDKVKTLYDEVSTANKHDKPTLRFYRTSRSIKHIKHVISNTDLYAVDDDILCDVMSDLDLISDQLNDVLTKKKQMTA